MHQATHGLIPNEIISVSDDNVLRLLGRTEHDLIIRRALVASRGREVKHTGDGIMASFDDVASALECSMAIQAGFEARAADGRTTELRVRIGIAAGEPVDRNDDSARQSLWLAGSVTPPRPGGSSRPISCARWAASEASRSMVVGSWS